MEREYFLGGDLKIRARTTREEVRAGEDLNQNQNMGTIIMATRTPMKWQQ